MEQVFPDFQEQDIKAEGSWPLYQGKVRDVLDLGTELLIITSDRISAFDRNLGHVPHKGEILNQMALHCFSQTEKILLNHVIETIGPRTILVKKAEVLPVEVVVRAYLTGSAWRDYEKGKTISGIQFPSGMKKNQAFDRPYITPSTKAEKGSHDEPISREEIIGSSLVERKLWEEVEHKALALFEQGQKDAQSRGLILVDTKYELALYKGRLILVDEIHTPDSSRYWYADEYEDRFKASEDQRALDKEYFRNWLLAQGFSGNGDAPEIPGEIFEELKNRYMTSFELITGRKFQDSASSFEAQKAEILSYLHGDKTK